MLNFLIGILSAVAAAMLIYSTSHFIQKARGWYRFRPFHQIWSPFLEAQTTIVLTGKKHGHTIKVSIAEIDAAHSIQPLLVTNKNVSQAVSERDSFQLDSGNIIALGSERTNEITRCLLRSLSGALDFCYTADNDLIVNGELFKSGYRDNILIKDYALVCKAANPYSKGHKFLAFAGNHGIGTQGAVLAITSQREAGNIVQRVGDSNFYAVIETEVDQRFSRSPTRVSVKRCGFITEANGQKTEAESWSRDAKLAAFLIKNGADDSYLQHVTERTALAVRLANAIQANGTDLDIDAIYFGAMLHDIGRIQSPTIEHGVKGVEFLQRHREEMMNQFLLTPQTFEKVCEAIECHIVGGIRQEWIVEAKLKLPIRDYLPRSLEAKIVAFCDQVLHDRGADDTILKEAPQYDNEVRGRFYRLTFEITSSLFGQQEKESGFVSNTEKSNPSLLTKESSRRH